MNAVIWAVVITAWACALVPPAIRLGRQPLWPPAPVVLEPTVKRVVVVPPPELVDWERLGWAS